MGEHKDSPFTLALIAGGCAGTAVDVTLFPLDTLRTRLQAAEGFWKAGGFRGIYSGLTATSLGAAPGAALFFSTYEVSKQLLKGLSSGEDSWLYHSTAASFGEVAACLVRVPTQVVTQRMQVGRYTSLGEAARALRAEGGIRAAYVGYWTTVAREIPFSFIQFPIYEKLKKVWGDWQGAPTTALQGAACGSCAGAVASSATTPLDVVKTRMMLEDTSDGRPSQYRGTLQSLRKIAAEEGVSALFKGIGPRVGWITLGGFVFFGAYEKSTRVLWTSGLW